jgi:hypothetical protein
LDAFDPTDLRLRIQAGLSAPEMRRLLGNWGATAEEAAAKDASRWPTIVRVGAKQFGLRIHPPALLEKPRRVARVLEAPDSHGRPMSVPGPTPAPPEVSAALDEPGGGDIVDARSRSHPSPGVASSPYRLRRFASTPRSPNQGALFVDATTLRGEPPVPASMRASWSPAGRHDLLAGAAFAAGSLAACAGLKHRPFRRAGERDAQRRCRGAGRQHGGGTALGCRRCVRPHGQR